MAQDARTIEKGSSVVFVLPTPPNRANSRLHHFARAKAVKEYFSECDQWMLANRQRGAFPMKKVSWAAHIEVAKLYDFDNLVSLLKWPLDYLVSRGYLVDDDPKSAWPSALPTQEIIKGRKALRKILLQVIPLPEGSVSD